MNMMLRVASVAAELATFWQAYEVLFDRDDLWSEEADCFFLLEIALENQKMI